MTLPGTLIVSRAVPPNRGGVGQTGTWHIAALAERGPTDGARLLNNLSDYDKFFGARVAYGARDSVEAYFRNGGVAVNMVRIVGPAATVATRAFPGAAAAPSIAVDTLGAGASSLTVSVDVLVSGQFTISVYENSVRVSLSPPLAAPTDAVNWASTNPYIRVRALGTVVPTVQAAVALTGGADDRASVTDVHRLAALNLIPKGAGPGQVSIPGATTLAAHVGVAVHAEANNRFALLDAPNTTVDTDLVQAAQSDQVNLTQSQCSYCFFVEGWNLIPGITLGSTRIVPPSAIVAALMAARDTVTHNPNEAAAGVNGIAPYSLGLARPNWNDAQREKLNDAGVNAFREIGGQNRLYGYRTLVDINGLQAGWLSASGARLRMALVFDADRNAEPFVFAQITKAKIAEFQGVLTGMLLGYYNLGALYGNEPKDAFTVDTGPTVNTPERISQRRLSAVMAVRMSEFAEVVYMEFVKIPITEELS